MASGSIAAVDEPGIMAALRFGVPAFANLDPRSLSGWTRLTRLAGHTTIRRGSQMGVCSRVCPECTGAQLVRGNVGPHQVGLECSGAQLMRANAGPHQVGLECSGIQVSSRGTCVCSRSGLEFGAQVVLRQAAKTFEKTCRDLAALRYMSIRAPANSKNLRGNVF